VEDVVLTIDDSSNSVQEGQAPRYAKIQESLRDAILSQRLPPSLVLLEGPLARMYGTSRGPVRKALELLHQEGLISRFEGRGFLATPEPETERRSVRR